ncbi:MAG: M28 family peptidase [Bacteroidetes bacterium]|nr:M28 family peptidase [Bacteroidota bacterium]
MSHKLKIIFFSLYCLIVGCNHENNDKYSYRHSFQPIFTLSSDQMKGRKYDSFEAEISSFYLSSQFEKIGLKKCPSYKNYFQNFLTDDSIRVRNVIGYFEGTNSILKDEYIVISAHYDHLGVDENLKGDSIYNGARDNAVGVCALLEIAKYFSNNPPNHSIVFALFTGEEFGYIGSDYFVHHPPFFLNKFVFNFNIDNIGYDDRNSISIIGSGKTIADKHFKSSCDSLKLALINNPCPEMRLFEKSDNFNFYQKGVPSITFCMGFSSFNDSIKKYYHKVNDEYNTLDYFYIDKYIETAILSVENIDSEYVNTYWKN